MYTRYVVKANFYYWKQACSIERCVKRRIELVEMVRVGVADVMYQHILYRHPCKDGSICVSDSRVS